jgi:superoxide reductase
MEIYNLKMGSGSLNKHRPVISMTTDKAIIRVGIEEHPMTEEHYIQWIVIQTSKGYKVAKLTHNDKPEVEFELQDDEKLIAAYEYCNLHGFWENRVR